MELPEGLRNALTLELDQTASKRLAAATRELAGRYRERHGRGGSPLVQSSMDAVAYTAYRLPATFAAVAAVFDEVRDRRPDFEPRSLLDVGAGPGTAAWAAVDVWPEIEHVTLLERDPRMIELGQSLVSHAQSSALRNAEWSRIDITSPWRDEPTDLAVAAYVIGELDLQTQRNLVRQLWESTEDMAVIVEPGTPRGFELIRRAGDELAAAGANILAPFPHGWQCVEGEGDWCHFSERVPRTRLHRAAKAATLAYEDEKYSYVVASRKPGVPIAARVIRHPQIRSGHVRLVLCTAEGVKHIVVARSDGQAFRLARKLQWGSAIFVEDAPLFGLSA